MNRRTLRSRAGTAEPAPVVRLLSSQMCSLQRRVIRFSEMAQTKMSPHPRCCKSWISLRVPTGFNEPDVADERSMARQPQIWLVFRSSQYEEACV